MPNNLQTNIQTFYFHLSYIYGDSHFVWLKALTIKIKNLLTLIKTSLST